MAEKDKKVAFTNQRTGITTYQEPTTASQAPSTSTSIADTTTSGGAGDGRSPTADFFSVSENDRAAQLLDQLAKQTFPNSTTRTTGKDEFYQGLERSYLRPASGGDESAVPAGPLTDKFGPYYLSLLFPQAFNVGSNPALRDALLQQWIDTAAPQQFQQYLTPGGVANYLDTRGSISIPYNNANHLTPGEIAEGLSGLSLAAGPILGGISAANAAAGADALATTDIGVGTGGMGSVASLAPAAGPGMLSTAALQAGKSAALAKLQGASLGQALTAGAKSGLTSAGTQGILDLAQAPTAAPAVTPPSTDTSFLGKRGMSAGGDNFFAPPESSLQMLAPSVIPGTETNPLTGMLAPSQIPGTTTNIGTTVPFDPMSLPGMPTDFLPLQSPQSAPAPAVPAPAEPSAKAQQYVASTASSNMLKALSDLHGGGAPANAPVRQQGQSDAQYASSLVDYATTTGGFNASALKGLTPGTQEYYDAVLSQMDSVIANLSKGLDLNASDLSAQFRGRSAKERDDLERALYVRGQLGQLMGSGQYLDPFTGDLQAVETNGAQVNPGRAAYQRGLAGSAETLAGLDPTAAYGSLQGMLSRTPDLYGMQSAMDERRLAEILAAQGIDPRKLRGGGMFDVNSLTPQDLAALLGSEGK